jgi:hypothetical protein
VSTVVAAPPITALFLPGGAARSALWIATLSMASARDARGGLRLLAAISSSSASTQRVTTA